MIKPKDCKIFIPRYGSFGKEGHSCPDCGEAMQVCDNCGGDYHEDAKVRLGCPSKRLNNSVRLDELWMGDRFGLAI